MKRSIKAIIMLFTVSTVFLSSCSKDGNTPNADTNSKPAAIIEKESSGGNSSNFVGANCTVPTGYTSCSSNCTFSDCCVVWNPKLETGGCGCFFGISTCKTAKIGANFSSSNATSDSKRTITFKFKVFKDFLLACKTNGIDISQISKSVDSKLLPNIIEGNSEKGIVDPNAFDTFLEEYENFINNLNVEQKSFVSSRIK